MKAEFGFYTGFNDVTRDMAQGNEGNLLPLNSKKTLESYAIWDTELVQENQPGALFKFSSIELGGADPQVTVRKRNKDWTQTPRDVSAVAPHSTKRPLWRGANAFMLQPAPKEELAWVLRQLAEDTASNKESANPELLRIKVFDSQGVVKEVESTLEIIAQLRSEGYKIGVEIAIPYSNGDMLDPNPYPDEFYVNKFRTACQLGKKHGIPPEVFRVSLKDMVGELTAENAKRLVPKLIDVLKEEELSVPIGLHLHDTGLAAEAYAAAIAACKEKNWPVAVDVVEGHNTGFASTTAITRILASEHGIDLGLKEAQYSALKKREELTDSAQHDYRFCRTECALEGAELRQFKTPGGGVASFDTAVKNKKLADILGISQNDALRLVGNAFIAVSEIPVNDPSLPTKHTLMGNLFAVTPGFQNKQIAALNFVDNLITAGILAKDMPLETMIDIVKTPLTPEQIAPLFMKGLSPVVQEFLRGELPTEIYPTVRQHIAVNAIHATLKKMLATETITKETPVETVVEKLLASFKITQAELPLREALTKVTEALLADKIPVEVHPVVAEAFGRRKGLLTDGLTSRIPLYQRVARELQEDGWIPEGEEASKSAVSWAIVTEDPETFRQNVMKSWWHEPDASQYPSKEEYARAQDRFRKGWSPDPDAADIIRQQLLEGTINEDIAHQRMAWLLEQEREEIRESVQRYLRTHESEIMDVTKSALVLGQGQPSKQAFEEPVKAIYKAQQDIINERLVATGWPYLYSEEDRTDIALQYFASEIVRAAKEQSGGRPLEGLDTHMRHVVAEIKEDIRSAVITTPTPGRITKIHVALQDGEPLAVTKGQPLFTIEIAKMEHTVVADRDADITSIPGKEGEVVPKGHVVMRCDKVVEKEKEAAPKEEKKTVRRRKPEYPSADTNGKEKEYNGKEKTGEGQSFQETPEPDEPTKALQARGYFVPASTKGKDAGHGKGEWLHVVGNRAGCAAKIAGGLAQAGHEVIVLYTDGDKTTPVVKNAPPGGAVLINNYMDQDEIIARLKKIAEENPGKKILFHPGWGFLSEKADFVAKIEKLKDEGFDIVFAGPPSAPMNAVGGKKSFRDLAESAAKECNPPYFGPGLIPSTELNAYIASGYSEEHPLHKTVQECFQKVQDMGGDVMIKAVDGGGGRGIKRFSGSDFKTFVDTLATNVAYSEKQFGNGEMVIERCMHNAQHVEAQIICTNRKGAVIGYRNCSIQDGGQKVAETNVIKGDFDEETIGKSHRNAKAMADELAELGYRGVGTLEMLVSPDGNVVFLEVNTRIQVEHPVTEGDIALKTGCHVSLPVLNAHLVVNNGTETPEEILHNVSGIEVEAVDTMALPGDIRVAHFRFVSKDTNLANGTSTPTWFKHDIPPHILARIAAEHNVAIIWGTLGGNYDPQIGAIYGKEADVQQAAGQLLKVCQVLQLCDRSPDKTNLEAVRVLYPLLFNPSGNVNRLFSTSSMHQILEAVKSGDFGPMQDASREPGWPGEVVLAPGALEACFNYTVSTRVPAQQKEKELEETPATMEKEKETTPTWQLRVGGKKEEKALPLPATSYTTLVTTNGNGGIKEPVGQGM